MPDIELTFCVVNTSQRELLLRGLDAIARERKNLPFATEVLVLDNGSHDGSAEAGPLHGGKVCVHALARQITVHEEPIDPGARIVVRLNEIPDLLVCIGERESVERNAHCGHANSR